MILKEIMIDQYSSEKFTDHKRSAIFIQKCAIFLQKRAIFPQKRAIFPQKRAIFEVIYHQITTTFPGMAITPMTLHPPTPHTSLNKSLTKQLMCC